jgi:GTP-binding protein YchF
VVRCFDDDNVIHVENKVDPIADIATINTELCLKDLDTVTKRLDKARKQAKGNDPIEKLAVPLCEKLVAHLDEGKPVRTFQVGDSEKEQQIVAEMSLLTSKRMFYVGNVAEGALTNLAGDKHFSKLAEFAKSEGAPVVAICAAIEEQIAQLEPADRPDFLASVGLSEPGLNAVIRTGYELLGLITFLTAGKQEVRAWTVRKGATAPQAAGVIHTDFERGFIKAEVIWWEDFIKYGSEAKCREAGKQAIEGRDYVVRDGDVMHFRFNV